MTGGTGGRTLTDAEKQEIQQWCVSMNGDKSSQEFYLSALGSRLLANGVTARSMGPCVGAANKQVKKALQASAALTGTTGVGGKRKAEDGISGALLDDGDKKQAAADHHRGSLVSPTPEDSSGLFLSSAGIGPVYAYNEKQWEPEYCSFQTVEPVNGISHTIFWYRIILAKGSVEDAAHDVDVEVIDGGHFLLVKTKRPGQSITPSRNHSLYMEEKQKTIAKKAGNLTPEQLKSLFDEYNVMVIREKAEMAVIEAERLRYKDNFPWNYLRIQLDKQCQTSFHYKNLHEGDVPGEGDSLLIGLKEVKEDVYHEKTAIGKMTKPQGSPI